MDFTDSPAEAARPADLGELAHEVVGEPLAHLGAEGGLSGGIGEIHTRCGRYWTGRSSFQARAAIDLGLSDDQGISGVDELGGLFNRGHRFPSTDRPAAVLSRGFGVQAAPQGARQMLSLLRQSSAKDLLGLIMAVAQGKLG